MRMANPLRLLSLVWYCLVVFLAELGKANWDMAKRSFSMDTTLRGPRIHPGIVKVPVNVHSEYGLSMLANSITLTPGTITMDIVEEDGENYFYIHWIDVAKGSPEEMGEQIKGRLRKMDKEDLGVIEFVFAGVFFVLLALSLSWRLYKGPSVVDRAICGDSIEVLCSCALILFSLFSGRSIYLDVSLVVAILGFISTVLWQSIWRERCGW